MLINQGIHTVKHIKLIAHMIGCPWIIIQLKLYWTDLLPVSCAEFDVWEISWTSHIVDCLLRINISWEYCSCVMFLLLETLPPWILVFVVLVLALLTWSSSFFQVLFLNLWDIYVISNISPWCDLEFYNGHGYMKTFY